MPLSERRITAGARGCGCAAQPSPDEKSEVVRTPGSRRVSMMPSTPGSTRSSSHASTPGSSRASSLMRSPTSSSHRSPNHAITHAGSHKHETEKAKKLEALERRKSFGRQTLEEIRKDPDYVRLPSSKMVKVADIKFLREYFDELDLNGNGTVDFEEIEAAMNKENVKGPQELSLESLETRDISGTTKKVASPAWGFQNGGAGLVKTLADKMNNAEAETEFTFKDVLRISYPEATAAVLKEMEEAVYVEKVVDEVREITEEEIDTFDQMWALWDVDHSGELDKEELRVALRELGVDDDDDFEDLYETLDTDNNGTISQSEFMAWWFKEDVEKNPGP